MDKNDIVVDISKAREKYFGCSGRVLIPSSATVAAFVATVPMNKIVTMDLLQTALARKFDVQVTCPVAARNALAVIARHPNMDVPHWRVVKKNGELFSIFPGGLKGHAALLQKEGFHLEPIGKSYRVAGFANVLVAPDQDHLDTRAAGRILSGALNDN